MEGIMLYSADKPGNDNKPSHVIKLLAPENQFQQRMVDLLLIRSCVSDESWLHAFEGVCALYKVARCGKYMTCGTNEPGHNCQMCRRDG